MTIPNDDPDKLRFRSSTGLKEIADRGLDWTLHAGPPGRAICQTPPGQPYQRMEFRHENCFTAAMQMIDAVLASDMRAAPSPTKRSRADGLVQLQIEVPA